MDILLLYSYIDIFRAMDIFLLVSTLACSSKRKLATSSGPQPHDQWAG